jgi:hypothetical protein
MGTPAYHSSGQIGRPPYRAGRAGRVEDWLRAATGVFLAFTGLFGVTVPALAAPPGLPLYREFRDWQIACDNTGRCEAKGFSRDDGSDAIAVIRVTREAGPDGTLVVSLESEGTLDRADVRILGGAAKRGGLGAGAWTGGGDQALMLRDPAGATAFLNDLRNADGLGLGKAGTVSLDGMTAALLAMDDAQGRVGTTTALVRPGNKPASAVPAARPLPQAPAAPPAPPAIPDAAASRIAAGVRAAQKDLLSASDCSSPDGPRDQVVLLTTTEALVMLQCIGGAYQSGYLLFRAPQQDPGAARHLVLSTPKAGRAGDVDDPYGTLIDPDYDPATGTLMSAGRGRGMGDCGSSARWVFDGKDFRIARYSFQDSCRGFPGDWPVLWRTTAED